MKNDVHIRSEIYLLCQNNPEVIADVIDRMMEKEAQYDSIISHLEARIKELESRLHQDSHNSHQPPSSDTNKRNYLPPKQRKSKRPAGGQPGHDGTTLKRVTKPDVIETHSVKQCSCCGKSLRHVLPRSMVKRQVVDVPPVHVVVTEHQSEMKCCPYCDTVTQAPFPENITKAVQYGNRIKSIATYLMHHQLIPADRTTQLMKDVFACSHSQGSLFRWAHELTDKTAVSYDAIKECVTASDVVHNDETGIHCAKETSWLHIAATPLATYLTVHRKRGREAIDAAGIMPVFRGTSIHDMWASYFRYDCRHGVCNAHLLRELTFALEEFKQAWAGNLKTLLCRTHRLVERRRASGDMKLDDRTLKRNRSRYDAILTKGLRKNPRQRGSPHVRGRVKQSKVRNLLERMRDHADSVLLFMYDFAVPFTNNLAERGLRMAKVKMKISGCFRRIHGAEIYSRIRSYLATAAQNGLSTFNAIVSAFDGQPFIPKNVHAD